ncbi:hypothetical protein GOP47_0023369 [Adiantum capillus-veneris]|uniref:Uncharacterized protein n=1 Tax=Adiantum capillus-veneris TaxID=13818 RepID=A0A9D4Z4E4_ADICA|nr:hypothetical protein GOP47_0023369 [Adiantum capillus-veneris]
MPLSHVLATKLGARLTEVRKNGTCSWLRPVRLRSLLSTRMEVALQRAAMNCRGPQAGSQGAADKQGAIAKVRGERRCLRKAITEARVARTAVGPRGAAGGHHQEHKERSASHWRAKRRPLGIGNRAARPATRREAAKVLREQGLKPAYKIEGWVYKRPASKGAEGCCCRLKSKRAWAADEQEVSSGPCTEGGIHAIEPSDGRSADYS